MLSRDVTYGNRFDRMLKHRWRCRQCLTLPILQFLRLPATETTGIGKSGKSSPLSHRGIRDGENSGRKKAKMGGRRAASGDTKFLAKRVCAGREFQRILA